MGCVISRMSSGTPPELAVDAAVGNATGAAAAATSTAGVGPGSIQYTAELNSYEAACRLDPELRTFDATLQQRTSRAISTLALGVEVHALSFDSLREVIGCLLEMNQEVVKVILDSRKDVWKNPELFELVEDYFENSLLTIDFCTALENCLKKARDSQLIIHIALQRFAADEQEVDVDGRKKYARTLEELRHFKVVGDPFTQEFFQLFQTVYRQQLSMLEKLKLRKRKLDKKLKCLKTWRKVSSIMFAAAFTAVIICSVVAAVVAAPPVAAALAAAASIPIPAGKWIDSLLKGYQDALERQQGILNSMHVGTSLTVKDLDIIQVLVDKLEIQIHSLLDVSDFSLRDEDAVRFGIEEIRKKLEEFMKSVDSLDEQADQCNRDISRARIVVLQKIIRHPN
ncbi:hypothetical protein GW17_00051242 [Ensete ventricosum]|nr:hypothetical protein GW17_00051242 [Ensete ventricosum]